MSNHRKRVVEAVKSQRSVRGFWLRVVGGAALIVLLWSGLIGDWGLGAGVALAQGLLVVVDGEPAQLPRSHIWPPRPPIPPVPPPPPRPPRPVPPPARYKIDELQVQATVRHQTAQVEVSQTFLNTGSRQLEVVFVFPLPYDGAVDRMTFLVDGKEIPARLLPADEARRFYEDIVRRSLDPALLEWIGTGLFRTSVFPVPPGGKRTVSIRYNQVLRMQDGLVDFLFPLSTAKYTEEPIRELNIRVSIESDEEIKNLYSPTHTVQIDRPDPRRAIVRHQASHTVPTTDFRLYYDVGRGLVSSKIISYRPRSDEDGFFLMLCTPAVPQGPEQPIPKTIIFVVDRSGSMSGEKIEQARQAAKQVLNALRPGDLFNIIAYDSTVELFRPELQRFEDETRRAALGFIDGLSAGGSTNINDALLKALEQIQDASRPSFILFLTDGLPTAGVTEEPVIARNVRNANRYRARLFVFGVGYDVNARLLDRLARDNLGTTAYVRPNESIEQAVSQLARRIELPVLTDVGIRFVHEGARPEDPPVFYQVYPKPPLDLFVGDQLVLAGRYRRPVSGEVVLTGRVRSETIETRFPAHLTASSPDTSLSFVEKLWAMRRVADIIEELDLHGRNEELIKELVQLSTRHGILTPYTSFLADEEVRHDRLADNLRRARSRLEALAQIRDALGVEQRLFAFQLREAHAPALAAPAIPKEALEAALLAERASEGVVAQLAEGEQIRAQANIRQLGDRTFFNRRGRWIQSSLSEAQEKQAKRVQMFSDEFFALVARYGRRLTQYLVNAEPIVLELDGQVYLFEP
ncbi:MAG: VIT domain-containing protein [Thermoguttaceae bacterium]|nr:VIT domain-containing protein [Thermoguttaceae bacterium]MDW8079885.1 VIT domain-containing protein [Thermoguttaceae bacterium]